MIESPCVGVCALDSDGYCIGCRRTGDEIAAWGSMPAAQQREMLQRLRERAASEPAMEGDESTSG